MRGCGYCRVAKLLRTTALTEKAVGLEDPPDEVGPTIAESGSLLEVGRGLIALGLGPGVQPDHSSVVSMRMFVALCSSVHGLKAKQQLELRINQS
jgi:hypothetical protein